jgi:hypothetical protein
VLGGLPFTSASHRIALRKNIGRYRIQRDSRGVLPGTRSRSRGHIIIIIIIINLVESAAPPLHLVLGKAGVERVREKLRGLLHGIDEWEAISLAADFPEG